MPKDTAPGEIAITPPPPGSPGKTRFEGITVVGEAIRRVAPESAEFVIEITAPASSAAQALRDNQAKTLQLAQALGTLGVHQTDLETLSMNVYNLYTPALPGLGGFAAMPQIGNANYPSFGGSYGASGSFGGGQGLPTTPMGNDVQFGSYHARAVLRVNVREPGRVGEVVDAAVRAGGTLTGGFAFKVSDESHARRAVLEAAAKDARNKAEALATATGRQLGEPVAISEDLLVSNGAYAALRVAVPFAFGLGTQRATGELEYYARVSANFRLQ